VPHVDLLLEPRWIIPIVPHGTILEEHAIAITGGRIAGIVPLAQARSTCDARRIVSLPQHAVMPGLVNLHTHAAMTLMRGLADDLPLMDWLNGHVWPAEQAHVSREFVHDGTLLACAEMLLGGITCFNDMYFFPEAAASAVLAARMRAAIGIIAVDFPSAYASDARDYLSKGLETRDAFRGEDRLSFCLAPHAPYTVGDASFATIATFANELELPVHVHLHETEHEVSESVGRHGTRPLARLDRLGLVGPQLVAVHAVHLEAHEIALLARQGCSVAHCPSSNMKLGSGIAPVAALLRAGVRVGIGTDGAASNNRLDLWTELRQTALLAKCATGDPSVVPAHVALRMATLDGATALGLADSIGSIESGKCADLIAIDFGRPELMPCFDPASHLVYAVGREHVSHVWVQGEPVVEAGGLTRVDPADIVARTDYWRQRIASHH
jgi:5-methylthioadenosine/S-adenosylhomocysteine deaminase